jgi:hypothetical protein
VGAASYTESMKKDEPLECGPPAEESTLVPGTVLIVSEGDHADKHGTVLGLTMASGKRVGLEMGLEAGTVALRIGPYNWKGQNGWLTFPLSSLCTVAAEEESPASFDEDTSPVSSTAFI